jgi:N-acetylglutamate synthase-like GNAT family acetyltransferase
MKGQKLFVRMGEPRDALPVSELLGATGADSQIYVARLVGDVVAAAELHLEGTTAELRQIVVREDMRRLRIATKTLAEIERQLAAGGVTRLTARNDSSSPDFLKRVGFVETNDLLIRHIETVRGS